MKQADLPSLPTPGWTQLAHGDQKDDRVARCPAGHIHLDYGNFSIRFGDEEFLAFARMVAEAAARVGGSAARPVPGSAPLRSLSIGFSPN